jgi:hypothetical protein
VQHQHPSGWMLEKASAREPTRHIVEGHDYFDGVALSGGNRLWGKLSQRLVDSRFTEETSHISSGPYDKDFGLLCHLYVESNEMRLLDSINLRSSSRYKIQSIEKFG